MLLEAGVRRTGRSQGYIKSFSRIIIRTYPFLEKLIMQLRMKIFLMEFRVQLQLSWMNVIIKEFYVFGFSQFGEIYHMLQIISSFSVTRNSDPQFEESVWPRFGPDHSLQSLKNHGSKLKLEIILMSDMSTLGNSVQRQENQ